MKNETLKFMIVALPLIISSTATFAKFDSNPLRCKSNTCVVLTESYKSLEAGVHFCFESEIEGNEESAATYVVSHPDKTVQAEIPMDISYTTQDCTMNEPSNKIKELTTKHFQIQASNWGALSQQSKQYPIFIYGFATDPQLSSTGDNISRFVQQIDQPEAFARMMIFSSHNAAGRHLSHQQTNELFKNKSIDWIGYNQEGDKTPASEFATPQQKVNAVIEFAKKTEQHGFKFIWGPIRGHIDRTSDADIKRMCDAGMDGVAIQEQNQVSGDGSNRIGPVNNVIRRFRNLCGEDFYTVVQIMWGQGGSCSQNCSALVRGIAKEANSIALWANQGSAGKIDAVFQSNSFFLQN